MGRLRDGSEIVLVQAYIAGHLLDCIGGIAFLGKFTGDLLRGAACGGGIPFEHLFVTEYAALIAHEAQKPPAFRGQVPFGEIQVIEIFL